MLLNVKFCIIFICKNFFYNNSKQKYYNCIKFLNKFNKLKFYFHILQLKNNLYLKLKKNFFVYKLTNSKEEEKQSENRKKYDLCKLI